MASRTKPRDEIEHTVKEALRLDKGTATVERLRKAGVDWTTEGYRQKISDSPLERLAKRQQLCSTDKERNARLYEAANQYMADWYKANMLPLKARDYRNPHTQPHEVGVPQAFRTDEVMAATIRHRKAKAAMGGYYFSYVVDQVVLAEQDLVGLGLKVTDYRDKAQARAATKDRLIEGLRRIAVYYGIMRS